MKRIVLLTLVIGMLLSVTACSKKEEEADSGADVPTEVTANEYEDYLNSLPKRDFGGKDYRVLTATQTREFYIVEEDNVLLSDTVLVRDSDVQSRYNMKLNYTLLDGNVGGSTAFQNRIRAAANSGEDGFDLVLGQTYYCTTLATEGMWQDLNTAEQINWEREWYHEKINNSTEFCGKRYGASGEYLMSQTSSSMCLLFNKTMYNDNGFEDDIYQLVKDYEWTYEKMNTMIADMYTDVNDNSERDSEDIYGFLGNSHTVNSMIVAGNCPITSYKDDGSVTVENYYSDHLISVFDYLYRFFNDNNSVRCATSTDKDVKNVDTFSVSMLSQGKTLFASTWIGNLAGSKDLKNAEDHIGVLPNPMYDTDQKEYITYNMRWELFYIPVNADMEYSATVLEYLNFTSMLYMLPQYYENALSLRGADEIQDAEMIKVVHDNMYYDFVTVFTTELGNLKDAVAYLIKTQSNTLSSWWDSNKGNYADSLILMQDFYS